MVRYQTLLVINESISIHLASSNSLPSSIDASHDVLLVYGRLEEWQWVQGSCHGVKHDGLTTCPKLSRHGNIFFSKVFLETAQEEELSL